MRLRRNEDWSPSLKWITSLLFISLASPTVLQARNQVPLNAMPFVPDSRLNHWDTHHQFILRHVFHHGTYQNPQLFRRVDIYPDDILTQATSDETLLEQSPARRLSAKSNGMAIQHLADRRISTMKDYLSRASLTGTAMSLAAHNWVVNEVDSPNITDRDTIITLATMSYDAYYEEPYVGDWRNVTQKLNNSQGFGWQGDGLRGQVFADERNETIIISFKGTSWSLFEGEGTSDDDKINDNLFGSCCCAQGGQYLWRQVCSCSSGTYSCDQTCIVRSLRNRNRYYYAALELYSNVTALYPESNIWLTGHSLGGVVGSLLGLTFGLPTVTFEAYGDALAASRLGLPSPPGSHSEEPQRRKLTGIHHFGHTADPIFMGTCNGAAASCSLTGYSLESQCHTGLQCVYDTVSDFGWRVSIGNHRLGVVIDQVIKAYNQTPICLPDDECVDCFNWKFYDGDGSGSEPSTTSSPPISTGTRTATCETPGWWGCLDKLTTTTSTAPSTTVTATTTTCLTPGWFGCKDSTTTTIDTAASAVLAIPPSTSVGATSTRSSSISFADMT